MGHGSKTDESCRCSPSEQTAGIVRTKETIVLWCRQKSPPPSTITSRFLRCAVCLGALSGRIFFRTTVLVRSVREDRTHADYMTSCEDVSEGAFTGRVLVIKGVMSVSTLPWADKTRMNCSAGLTAPERWKRKAILDNLTLYSYASAIEGYSRNVSITQSWSNTVLYLNPAALVSKHIFLTSCTSSRSYLATFGFPPSTDMYSLAKRNLAHRCLTWQFNGPDKVKHETL